MKLIMSAGPNWEIGYNNDTIFKSNFDMQHFKKLTKYNDDTSKSAVIMGRKTYYSIGSYLSERVNIVMSSSNLWDQPSHVLAVKNTSQLLELLRILDIDENFQWVIGGAAIYDELLNYCTEAYVTKFLPYSETKESINADTFFDIEKKGFKLDRESVLYNSDLSKYYMKFCKYIPE